MIVVSGADIQGVNIPIRGCTCTVSRTRELDERLHAVNAERSNLPKRYSCSTAPTSDRGEGSISVVNLRTRKVITKWRIPGGGSPDMGGVSANGNVLWLTGRYNSDVYAISTRNGRLLARIPVGAGPHGLCVWPQPGRYSLGHTGILR